MAETLGQRPHSCLFCCVAWSALAAALAQAFLLRRVRAVLVQNPFPWARRVLCEPRALAMPGGQEPSPVWKCGRGTVLQAGCGRASRSCLEP